LPHPASLIRRNIFEKTGLYDISLPISADWKLFITAIFKYKCTYKAVDVIFSNFFMDGMSCQPKIKAVVEGEKRKIYEEEFPELLNMINAYRKMRFIESSRIVNLLRKLGFFKYLS
jgi:hypothetical protein